MSHFDNSEVLTEFGSKTRRWFESLAIAVILISAIQVIALAFSRGLSESEIFPLSASRVLQNWFSEITLLKPVFVLFLSAIQFVTSTDTAPLILARLSFAGIALLNLFLFSQILQVVIKNRILEYFILALLASHTFFTQESFFIRSDFLAQSFVFLSLLLALKNKKLSHILAAAGLGLLCTVKAVYWLPFIFLSIDRKHRTKFLSASVCIFLCAGLAGILISKDTAWFRSLQGVQHYAEQAIQGQSGSPAAYSPEAFYYVFRIFTQNLVFYGGCLLFVFLFVLTPKKMLTLSPLGFKLGVLSLLILVLHFDRLPFFISSYFPFLVIFAAAGYQFGFDLLNEYLPKIKNVKYIVFASLISLQLFLNSMKIVPWLEENKFSNQLESISEISSYLAQFPGSNYYDMTGLYRRNPTFWRYVGPNSNIENQDVVEFLMSIRPDFIFLSDRLNLLGSKFESWLRKEYVYYQRGMFAKSAAYDLTLLQAGKDGIQVRSSQIKQKLNSAWMSVPLNTLTFQMDCANVESSISLLLDVPDKKEKQKVLVTQTLEFPDFEERSIYVAKDCTTIYFSPYRKLVSEKKFDYRTLFRFDREARP